MLIKRTKFLHYIIVNQYQSTTVHRPLPMRAFENACCCTVSSRLPPHRPRSVLYCVYLNAVFTQELVYSNGCSTRGMVWASLIQHILSIKENSYNRCIRYKIRDCNSCYILKAAAQKRTSRCFLETCVLHRVSQFVVWWWVMRTHSYYDTEWVLHSILLQTTVLLLNEDLFNATTKLLFLKLLRLNGAWMEFPNWDFES